MPSVSKSDSNVPNVVLIEADQLSAKWLGCYGNPAAHTPNLDRLAARGMRFDNCYTCHPVCMPSRSSTMTGRSAQHHGVFYNGWELGTELPTFPQVLQHGGVQTFGVGKFHLECHGRSAFNDVLKYGFDRAETTEDIRAGDWLDWVEQAHPECYQQALATVWTEPHLSHYGPQGRDLLTEIDMARHNYPVRHAARHCHVSIVPERASQTHWIADRAIAFLRERDINRPFFLKMSFVAPHDPYDPPARFLEQIDPDRIPPPVRSSDPSLREVLARLEDVPFVKAFSDVSDKEWRTIRRYYLASLAFVDQQVERLLDAIRSEGLEDNTCVIFTADHGDMMGDHGLPSKGAWHFDACMRIPLLVAGPGVRSGRYERQVVTNLDLFPTVARLTGIEHAVPVEGRSLLPLLAGKTDPDRPNAALVETYGSYGRLEPPFQARTVVTPDARLTLFGDGTGMLFDLPRDPHETRNLFGQSEAGALQCDLTAQMAALVARQYQPLPNRNRHPTAEH